MKPITLTTIFVLVWVATWAVWLNRAPYHWIHAILGIIWCIGTVGLSIVVYRGLNCLKQVLNELDGTRDGYHDY